jgi:PAS domain S-box-containing protein
MSTTGTTEILLVEDEAIVAIDTKQLLEKRGFAVTVAHSAVDAVTAVGSHSFDLVLMDIDLGPRKPDGTEAAVQILQKCHLPIIFLTSHSEEDMVDRVRGITRYGYVLKNSGDFVLLQAIETAMELFRAHRELEEAATRRRETEALYRLVVRHSEEAITLFDTDGRILLINEKAAANLGGEPADFSGKRLSDFLPAKEADRAIAGLALAMESRESSVTEWEVSVPEGSRWFRSRIHPVLNDDGRVLSILSSSLDITEQISSAKALAKAERFARIVADSVPALVYVHDFKARRNTWANQAHREFF